MYSKSYSPTPFVETHVVYEGRASQRTAECLISRVEKDTLKKGNKLLSGYAHCGLDSMSIVCSPGTYTSACKTDETSLDLKSLILTF